MVHRWPVGTIRKRVPKKEEGGSVKKRANKGAKEGEIENKRGHRRKIRNTERNYWRKGPLEPNAHLNPSSTSAAGKCQIAVWVHQRPISPCCRAQASWCGRTSRLCCKRGVSLDSANRQQQTHTTEGRKAIKEHPTLGMDTARGRRKLLNNEVLKCARSFRLTKYARILKINPSSHSFFPPS